jgi:hypothetical protein
MIEKKRVVKCVIDANGKLGITAISLVEFPAIEEQWVHLSEHKLQAINEERMMLYGAALIPNKHILRIDGDGNEYYITFDADTIQQCAHLYLKKNLQHSATMEHQFAVTGCTLVESWIVESSVDKSTALGFELPVGTWMLGMKVDDPAIWEEVKAGSVKGFSIEGIFNEVSVTMSAATSWVEDIEALLIDLRDKKEV